MFKLLTKFHTQVITAGVALILIVLCTEMSKTNIRNHYVSLKHEYQLDIDDSDGYTIFQDGRFVARIPFGENPSLDTVMLDDNL